VEENVATLKFYRNMSMGACGVFLIVALLVKSFTGTFITMTVLAFIIHGASNKFMTMMSRPQLTDSGSILDSGTDLNLEGGVAE
jgi:SRP-independent targeting protein 2/TMEM208